MGPELMDSFVTGRRREAIYSGVSTSCTLKRNRETQGLLYCHFLQKRFTFSSYSETIYSMSVSLHSHAEHHSVSFASGKKERVMPLK